MPGPFDSQALEADTRIFYRQGEDGSIEGYVIDDVALVEALKERVLTERGLSEVVEVAPVSARIGSADVYEYAFEHDFAEPFAGVVARLNLAPLDVPFSEQILLPLIAMVALIVVIGMWGLYQVVKTQVEFAERQSNFVSAVTHELKTPLTAIRMHGEMLRDGLVESPDKAQEYYGTITSQAERLSRLIGNVLWLSNIEKSADNKTRPTDIEPLLESATRTLLPHVEKSGFSLQLDLPDEIPRVDCEADSLEQIVFNLVDNSLKYASGAEDRRLSIGVEVGQHEVEVSLRDRGPGVPDEQLSKIFFSFYRGEDELTRKTQGTGLGLSLVRSLAQRMNARVEASNVDPGLKISVFFRRT